mmetsp:Transcript_2785/g.6075  ORF Transcript_2785/g.6075 Transcript_2785/m.6075 type:complete len:903 (-) Transcript_2785:420-3128(-)
MSPASATAALPGKQISCSPKEVSIASFARHTAELYQEGVYQQVVNDILLALQLSGSSAADLGPLVVGRDDELLGNRMGAVAVASSSSSQTSTTDSQAKELDVDLDFTIGGSSSSRAKPTAVKNVKRQPQGDCSDAWKLPQGLDRQENLSGFAQLAVESCNRLSDEKIRERDWSGASKYCQMAVQLVDGPLRQSVWPQDLRWATLRYASHFLAAEVARGEGGEAAKLADASCRATVLRQHLLQSQRHLLVCEEIMQQQPAAVPQPATLYTCLAETGWKLRACGLVREYCRQALALLLGQGSSTAPSTGCAMVFVLYIFQNVALAEKKWNEVRATLQYAQHIAGRLSGQGASKETLLHHQKLLKRMQRAAGVVPYSPDLVHLAKVELGLVHPPPPSSSRSSPRPKPKTSRQSSPSPSPSPALDDAASSEDVNVTKTSAEVVMPKEVKSVAEPAWSLEDGLEIGQFLASVAPAATKQPTSLKHSPHPPLPTSHYAAPTCSRLTQGGPGQRRASSIPPRDASPHPALSSMPPSPASASAVLTPTSIAATEDSIPVTFGSRTLGRHRRWGRFPQPAGSQPQTHGGDTASIVAAAAAAAATAAVMAVSRPCGGYPNLSPASTMTILAAARAATNGEASGQQRMVEDRAGPGMVDEEEQFRVQQQFVGGLDEPPCQHWAGYQAEQQLWPSRPPALPKMPTTFANAPLASPAQQPIPVPPSICPTRPTTNAPAYGRPRPPLLCQGAGHQQVQQQQQQVRFFDRSLHEPPRDSYLAQAMRASPPRLPVEESFFGFPDSSPCLPGGGSTLLHQEDDSPLVEVNARTSMSRSPSPSPRVLSLLRSAAPDPPWLPSTRLSQQSRYGSPAMRRNAAELPSPSPLPPPPTFQSPSLPSATSAGFDLPTIPESRSTS